MGVFFKINNYQLIIINCLYQQALYTNCHKIKIKKPQLLLEYIKKVVPLQTENKKRKLKKDLKHVFDT